MSKASRRESVQDRAGRVLPAAGFGNLKSDLVIQSGRAGRVWDSDGREYVDFILGSGPMLVGHAHPEVVAAVEQQLPKGTTFFAMNEAAIELAEAIVEAVPCAEQVRYVSSGSEATLYAMRLARAHRGREKILKFEGGYHGMSDFALMSMAPKREVAFPEAVPDSAGIPAAIAETMLIAPFNDLERTAEILRAHRGEVAAVIVEPFQRLLSPCAGFLEGLRELTREEGVLLIFDEVVTGFRFAYGGAQEYYGVVPDLCALGKVIGGGFPLAAVAGSAELLAYFDPQSPDFAIQIGTLSGNPVASVAGIKTLEILRRSGCYEKIFETGRALMEGVSELLKAGDVEGQVVGEPPLFDVVFGVGEIRDYRAAAACDGQKLQRFNRALRDRGVLKGDTKFYVSLAHTGEDVRDTLDAVAGALGEL